MQMNIGVYPDLDALSGAALEALLSAIGPAIQERGRFAVALSGGHTPARLYALWAAAPFRDRTPWDRMHLFWGDERFVPLDDPLSNYRLVREALITRVPIPDANVHPFPVQLPRPEDAAAAYERELHDFFSAGAPAFDVQLQGLGAEGHTASIFPGSPALEERSRWVMAVEAPANPRRRLTLTPAVLNCGRKTIFLVSGAGKRAIVAALRAESSPEKSDYPAARIKLSGEVRWFLDREAAG
ncbi:MAG TPA: 6-phosphogluconolactonase [Candidatus Acidoferrales bacterium]|nr:6-phosphogluconolactonase [Candidatus Acidoferrales bacterium]